MLTIEGSEGGTVTLVGRFDAAEAPAAQACLDRMNGNLILDCRRLDYISSAGLGVLLKTQKRLLAKSTKLRLVGVSPHIRDIFAYSGFDQIFEIEPAG
jgi:anti-anti-sigma factor